MTKRQRIFFLVGAWGCVATSVIHMAGQLAPRPAPANETEATLLRLLSTYQKDFGLGILRTTLDFMNGFSVAFSLFLAWTGLAAVLVFRRHRADAVFMLLFSRVAAVFSAALLVVAVVDFFLPPAVCIAVVFLGFAGASIGSGSLSPRPGARAG
jgi:small-conductance mechanosensitive channel